MFRIIAQSRDEKIAMYMKLTKRGLAEMLVNANEALALHQNGLATVQPNIGVSTTWGYGAHTNGVRDYGAHTNGVRD